MILIAKYCRVFPKVWINGFIIIRFTFGWPPICIYIYVTQIHHTNIWIVVLLTSSTHELKLGCILNKYVDVYLHYGANIFTSLWIFVIDLSFGEKINLLLLSKRRDGALTFFGKNSCYKVWERRWPIDQVIDKYQYKWTISYLKDENLSSQERHHV